MVGRIVFFLLVCMIPSYSFSQEISVNSIGIKNLSEYMIKDFSFSGEVENLFLLEDTDALSFIYFQAFRKSYQIDQLKNIVFSVHDEDLKDKMIYEIFFEAKERQELTKFKEIFKDLLSQKKYEKLRLLTLISLNEVKDDEKFIDMQLQNYYEAYKKYKEKNYKEATHMLEPFKKIYAQTFLLMLLYSGEVDRAVAFVESGNINDEYLKALTYFFKGDCNKVLNIKPTVFSYKLELLKMECSFKNSIDYVIPAPYTYIPEIKGDDEYLIVKTFLENEHLRDEKIYPYYQSFYYMSKLLSYAKFLEIYVSELNLFIDKFNTLNKDLQILKENFDKILPKIENKSEALNLAIKINSLLEYEKKWKNIEPLKIKSYLGIYNKLHEDYEIAKRKLLDKYQFFKQWLIDEENRLTLEKDFRIFDKNLKKIDSMDWKDIVDKLISLEKLEEKSKKYEVSFLDRLHYNKIYLLWEIYLKKHITDTSKRVTTLDEIINLSESYLKRFNDKKADVMLLLAEAFEHKGETEKALETFVKVTKLFPQFNMPIRIYIKIGDLYFDKKLYDEARKYYVKAIGRKDIYESMVYYKIGWTYYLQERYKDVIELFLGYEFTETGVKSGIILNEMLDLLGKAFYKIDDPAALENYLNKYPSFGYPEKLYKSIGDLYLALAEYNKALTIYEKGLEKYYMYRDSSVLLSSRIELLIHLGRQNEAAEEKFKFANLYGRESNYFRRFGEKPKEYDEIVLTGGYFYYAQYEKKKDEDSFQKAVNMFNIFLNETNVKNEKTGEVSFLLAQLYEDKRDFSMASNLYKRAYEDGFKKEDSFFAYLFCLYNLWLNNQFSSQELTANLNNFIYLYPSSSKSVQIYLVLANLELKNKKDGSTLEILEKALEIADKNDIDKIVLFLKINFNSFSDLEKVAQLFQKGYEKTLKYDFAELKHYALFQKAQMLEKASDLDNAIRVYKKIIDDKVVTVFREASFYNMGIIYVEKGDINSAINYMTLVKKGNLEGKATEFLYEFGKKYGYYKISGEAAEKIGIKNHDNNLLFESAYFYIKAKEVKDAERVLSVLDKLNLDSKSKIKKDVLDGMIAYLKGDYSETFKKLALILENDIDVEIENEASNMLHDVTKKLIFTFSDEEVRNYIEKYVDACSRKYKEGKGSIYLFRIGETLSDFAIFFIQKEDVIKRAKYILKKALKDAVENSDVILTLSAYNKLKEIDESYKNKNFSLPPVEVEPAVIIERDRK